MIKKCLKCLVFLFLGMLFSTQITAQDKKVYDDLKKKFEIVSYDPDCDYYRIHQSEKWGLCDSKGRVVIKPKYDLIVAIHPICDEYLVELNGKKGMCDSKGREIIPTKYDWVNHFAGKGYLIKNGDKCGFLNEKRRMVVPIKYDAVYPINSIYAVIIKKNNVELIGYYDSKGSILIPPKYYSIESRGNIHSCGVDEQTYRYKHDIYDTTGKFLFTLEGYRDVSMNGICDGVIKVENKVDGKLKYGYVSAIDGSELFPTIYDIAHDFENGVASVVKDGVAIVLQNPLRGDMAMVGKPKVKGRAVSTYPIADSEVDKKIPNGKKKNAQTFAFIIANENYPAAKVPYALNDGWAFEKYCKQTLGIKDENVHLFEDATGGNIMACVEQMKQTARAADGDAAIIFYYAGHAFPDEASKNGYLLPIDGDSKNTATGYSLEKLYKELNSISAKQIVCFIDACFSGTTREDNMLIAGRGVALKVNDEVPQGNTVVMTSATGAETAHSYEEMRHGLFTYYLLEKLQQTKGDVTLGELSEYVTKMVKRKSVHINQKKQTPTVVPSPSQQGTWQDIRL